MRGAASSWVLALAVVAMVMCGADRGALVAGIVLWLVTWSLDVLEDLLTLRNVSRYRAMRTLVLQRRPR